MIKVIPNPVSINQLYMDIRRTRPNWFAVSAGIEIDDYSGFVEWLSSHITFWYKGNSNFVLVRTSRHSCVIHPLFLAQVDRTFLNDVLADLEKNLHRTEVPIMEHQGHTMRLLLRDMGFQKEGILRDKEYTVDKTTGEVCYHDVELWAKLSERRL